MQFTILGIIFMVEESNYWSDMMKKHFNKELVVTKQGNENFKNFTKFWICGNYCLV